MSRRKKVASVAFTGVAALGTVTLTATHARAASVSKVTVTPGGAYGGRAVGPITFVDTTTGFTITCKTGGIAGNLTGGAVSGTLGTISDASFNSCSELGVGFMVRLNKRARLTVTSPTAGSTTKGELTGISVTISAESALTCKATLTGSLPVSYTNGGLTIDPGRTAGLTVQVGSCLGVLNTGDAAYWNATYAISPPQTISAT